MVGSGSLYIALLSSLVWSMIRPLDNKIFYGSKKLLHGTSKINLDKPLKAWSVCSGKRTFTSDISSPPSTGHVLCSLSHHFQVAIADWQWLCISRKKKYPRGVDHSRAHVFSLNFIASTIPQLRMRQLTQEQIKNTDSILSKNKIPFFAGFVRGVGSAS